MRNYQHQVDPDFVERQHQRFVNRRRATILGQIEGGSVDLDYLARIALRAFFEGVATAWALEDDDGVVRSRNDLGQLVASITHRFAPADIHGHMGFTELLFASLADDPQAVRNLATIYHNRPHRDPEGLTTPPYNHDLADAFSALLTGDDARALEAARAAAAKMNDPTAPPPVSPWLPVTEAMAALVAGDGEAMGRHTVRAIEVFAQANAPSSDQRSGLESLINTPLSVLYRVAGWRGAVIPASPYILPLTD